MPATTTDTDELDLHWKDSDPDLGIASEGVLCKDMDDIILRISEVKDTVKKIKLDNQHAFNEVPAVLGECKLLEELNISHTNITKIPDFLFTLPNLHSLSLCCRDLIGFPRGISKAEKLTHLHLRINKNWTLPDVITSLKNLKTLFVDLYSDAELPKKLGVLTNLEELHLAIKYDEGVVPFLPDSLGKHPVLRKVSINDPFYKKRKVFDLEHAAQILSSCPKLESLILSGLSVGKGHQNLSRLTGLKELELRHLLVEGNIFDSTAKLHKLEKLDIWGSEFKIAELPDTFENFKELRGFSLAGNFINELPPSIYNLANLTSLEIGSTGITALDEKIGDLKNLERLHAYDNLLEKLPDAIFTLPRLELLNIEENFFRQEEIAAIKEKLDEKKIEFLYDGQGHRQYVKKLRALKNIDKMDIIDYYKLCVNAMNENMNAFKYVNKEKLQGSRYYAQLCVAAARKNYSALETIDPKMLEKSHYFLICAEAVKNRESGQIIKLIKDNFLTDEECIRICIEAAINNSYADFLDCLNGSSFMKRFSREIYERICWIAILHYPPTFSKMQVPTEELRLLAEKLGQ